jgi:hypothetical protein
MGPSGKWPESKLDSRLGKVQFVEFRAVAPSAIPPGNLIDSRFVPHLRSRLVKRDRDRLPLSIFSVVSRFRTNPLRGLPESIPDTLAICSRVTGKPELILKLALMGEMPPNIDDTVLSWRHFFQEFVFGEI